MSSAIISAMRPSRGPRSVLGSVVYSACGVFQSRHRPTELFESGDRGVDVCLVEQLASAYRIALDHDKDDFTPLGVEALS